MSATRARGGMGLRIELSGTAEVCCVHDRKKDEVTTEAQVAALGLLLNPPIIYDPRIHRLQWCACCRNLFFDPSDEPRYCTRCQGRPVHALGGPLPDPKGVVA